MVDHDPEGRLRFDRDRRLIGVRVGKVELGQHLGPAFQEAVRRGLGVSVESVAILPVSTRTSPNDGLTAGSLSVQVTGAALMQVAKAWGDQLREAAGRRLNAPAETVRLDPDGLIYSAGPAHCDLFDLVPTDALGPVIGESVDRIAGAIRGRAAFIQDMSLDGMRHGRALRGRSVAGLRPHLPEGAKVIEDGGFAAIVLAEEAGLAAVWDRLDPFAPERDDRFDGPPRDWIKTARRITTGQGPKAQVETHAVSASRPFLLHGSIGPSCALALWAGGQMIVWTHSQGIFPLRAQIARVLDMAEAEVDVRFVPSAGCYGHTAADDAAMDAALIAKHLPGCPIRVAWPRADEIQFGPVGPPMLVEAGAGLDAEGRIASWRQEIWSAPHGQRPGGFGQVNLLGAMERDPALWPRDVRDLPQQVGLGAERNAMPIYALRDVAITTHIVQDLPVRTSSLRGLGAQMNTVAIEALMDRIAVDQGLSPFEIRHRHLDDPRAAAVLATLEAQTRPVREATNAQGDSAFGIALGRYKNVGAYGAVGVALTLEDHVKVTDVWAIVDAGDVLSPDGLRNQIEGGILQAVSWTLWEGVMLRGGRIDALGWDEYPTLPWSEVPNLHVTVMEQPDAPPLGVGECMVGPVSAAIVNAVRAALGETVADLPLDRATLMSAIG